MKKFFIFLILFSSIVGLSYADDISISADVDRKTISIDDQITLTINVSGNVSNIPQPDIPPLNGFTAYSSGRSQNISVINGQWTSSVSFTYILVPTAVGDYTLGPFTINYKGSTYQAGPIDIKVTSMTQAQQGYSTYGHTQAPTEPYEREPKNKGNELFIETYVDKLTAFVNEQITLTFAFYQAVDLFENPVYNPPSTTGFWTEDMPPQKKYYKVINGRKYLVTEIKTALFATSPGVFTIGSARLEASVEDMERFFSRRSPFDIFDRDPFSIFKRGKHIVLTTEHITVDILQIPDAGKPLNFKGDVGSFNMSATVDKNTVEENQPVTLKIKIQGKGNIKTVSPPNIPEIDKVKIYDSGSSENISKEGYVVQGEKRFEKVIIPKYAGTFTIGPIQYSYFDPAAKKYIEEKVEYITINVTESKEPAVESSAMSIPGIEKEEVELLKKDIIYIKPYSANLKPKGVFLYKNRIFLLINILPFLFLILFYVYEMHRKRLRTDVGYARSRRAKGLAEKRLKKARDIMSKEKAGEFYAELYKAVIEYIADKLNIPHPSITKDILEKKLENKKAPKDSIEKLKELFDVCDMARFTPSSRFTKEDMHNALEEAMDVITGLERIR